ncbi:UDP-glucose 4-epimerase GalE [Fluoribacter gormanii]|uniref:UDP-glucose 4-epimerase GalE n=1 Tax=Fluoribacter gormanii TaxID=464 RepID=UPI0022446898|nr:UDP-glucose 4-epimerase GalE [Fluoribacter gormanii]MCW8470586.1 UDP-glucose 4-epimerase GalE [Fluoribacter gormanii]
MKLLVTGATGYIGSHFCVSALQNHHELIMVDDLSNSSIKTLNAIETLSQKKCNFVQLDLCDEQSVARFITKNQDIDVVVHLAAKKNVYDSIHQPLNYYRDNVIASFFLLNALQKNNINKFLFSSTAAVYIDAGDKLYKETFPVCNPSSPYSHSKFMFETMLNDYCRAEKKFSAISLRYFNVAGAHPSALLGESLLNSSGIFPELLKVATKRKEYLNIYGNDYPTPDGTAIRDYIHVMDLIQGHLDALNYLDAHSGFDVFNLGRGEGSSVLNLVNTLENELHTKIPYHFKPRRQGDLCSVIADPGKANQLLGWHAKYTIKDIIHDAWQYSNTPHF